MIWKSNLVFIWQNIMIYYLFLLLILNWKVPVYFQINIVQSNIAAENRNTHVTP